MALEASVARNRIEESAGEIAHVQLTLGPIKPPEEARIDPLSFSASARDKRASKFTVRHQANFVATTAFAR